MAQFPQTPPQLAQAMREHLAGDLASAEVLYRAILEADPDCAQARHYLGFLLQQTDRLPEAFEQLSRAVALDDRHAEWHFNLGIVLLRQGRASEAIAAFIDALARGPHQYFYWTNLGSAFEKTGETNRAEQCFIRATEINGDCPDAWYLLASLCLPAQRYDEARYFNHRGVVAASAQNTPTERIMLGQAYHALGRVDDAIAVFEARLLAEPDNPQALHYLSAYRAEPAPAQCSSSYVQSTYDEFATSFEHILGRLKYCGPQLVADYLAHLNIAPASLQLLDLGCGTGLTGAMLKPYATQLVGVDLSQAMLGQAQAKGIYDRLSQADITTWLRSNTTRFDLVACMDTLIYIGNLNEVMALVYQCLQPGGRVLFSTERAPDSAPQPWQLNLSGRYSHRHADLLALLDSTGFVLEHGVDVPIRTESGCPITGEFICARKPLDH